MNSEHDIFQAATGGDLDRLAEILRDDPAQAGARDPNGVSVLLHAAYHRQADAARLLREASTGLDLFEAAAFGDAPRLQELITTDAESVRRVSGDGFTALHLAAFFARSEAARILLDAGADPAAEAGNPSRVTPLHSAAAARDAVLVELLLKRGAHADAVQHGGWTALHSAAKHGDTALVEALLAHGADPAQAADDGRLPADLAAAEGHHEIAERLRAANRPAQA